MTKQLMALFDGLDTAHGEYRPTTQVDSRGKHEGRHKVLKVGPTLQTWQAHLWGKVGLGVFPLRPDNTIRFAAIDVDEYPLDHAELERKFKAINLPLVMCRSKSGGAHLYLFASEDIPATVIRKHLMNWVGALGIKKYDLFPSANTLGDGVGNFINMPYFNNERGTQHAIIDGVDVSLEQFIEHAEAQRCTAGDLDLLVIPEPQLLKDGPPCLHALVRNNGVISDNRNNALLSLGVYAKKRYSEDWEQRLDELNNQMFTDHQHASCKC